MAASTTRRTAVWIVIGLLCLGMVGFGASGFGSTIRSIGTVGTRDVPVQAYANALNDQMRAFSAQIGSPITLQQAQAIGLDRIVLSELIAARTMDDQAAQLGISVGDVTVRDQILRAGDFQGLDGTFDREAYRLALQQMGLTEAQFETALREDVARSILQGAIAGGVAPQQALAQALVTYQRESRAVTWAAVTPDMLTTPLPVPSEAELQAFYDAHPDEFTAPETRDIAYVWLTPDMIQDSVTVDEQAVSDLYQERIADFVRPERRLVERLVFIDEAAATSARARLDAGEIGFDALVAERGLSLSDIDLGDMALEDLGEAGAAVFAAAPGDVVGPLPSGLGPALFRLNGVLAADETPFAEAAPDLRAELANQRARREIADLGERIADLLAGGATLEDLDAQTDLEAGRIAWSAEVTDGIAAYDAFRAAAASVTEGQFPELGAFEDGGLFLIRLDGITPPALRPFAEVSGQVRTAWEADAARQALLSLTEAQAQLVRDAGGFDAPGVVLVPTVEGGLTRADFVEGTPADFLNRIFAMAVGEVAVLDNAQGAVLVRLDGIAPPDTADPVIADLTTQLAVQAADGLATDLYEAFNAAVQQVTEIRIDDAAVNAVHASFQ